MQAYRQQIKYHESIFDPSLIYPFMLKLRVIHFSHSSSYVPWALGYPFISTSYFLDSSFINVYLEFQQKMGIPPQNSKILTQPWTCG